MEPSDSGRPGVILSGILVDAKVVIDCPAHRWRTKKAGMSFGGESSCASLNAAISARLTEVGLDPPRSDISLD